MTTNQKLLICLLHIRKEIEAENPIYLEGGICEGIAIAAFDKLNLARYGTWSRAVHPLFDKICAQWPLFSGTSLFPVPHPTLSSSMAFNSHRLWDKDTPYGQARLDLLNFAITMASQETSNDTL